MTSFAQKAFRRPLSADEQARFLKVYTDTKTAGGSINEAVQYSVYAALQSPLFLYRTEFGGNSTVEGPLAPYEMASQLSLFLSDGPPISRFSTLPAEQAPTRSEPTSRLR